MTVSTHVYTAELLGTPDVALSVQGGSITLDVASSPHVSATLTIARPDEAVSDALDPRLSPPPRVRVTADATFTAGAPQHREFDLTVRSRPVRHGDGTVSIELASDEALVDDYGPLADVDLRSLTDLATLCESVILTATGDTVSVGGDTATVKPLWDATNLLLNPSLEVDAANWSAGAGASALTRVAAGGAVGSFVLRWTAAAGSSDVYPHATFTSTRAQPGKIHTFSTLIYSPTPRQARLVLRFLDVNAGLLAEYSSPYTLTSAGGFTRYTVQGLAPSNANFVFGFINTIGNAAGNQHFTDAAYLSAGDFDPGYFDGDTADTAEYNYAWTGTAHASSSTRTALIDAPEPAALVWDAGKSGMDFLVPLVQAAGLRLVCDEARQWTLRGAEYTAAGSLSISHAINLIDADDVIDRDNDTWYDAAVVDYIRSDVYGIEQLRRDSFGMPGYSRVRRFEKRTAFPGPGFAEYAVSRAQGRGRTVTAVSVADWRAQAEQPIQVVLENTDTQTGKTDRVTFDLDSDELTVTTRTVDTPDTAYTFGPEGVSYLDVPVGISYEEFDWSLV